MEFAFENHVIEDGGGGGEGGGEEVHRDVQDDLSWVLHQVHSLGHTCEEADVTPAMLEVLHSLFSEVRRGKKRGEDIRARTHSPTHSLVTYRISSHSFTTLHHSLTHSHTHSHTY
jgi:hypothetical protein